MNMSAYADDKQHEYSTITNDNKEKHGELMITIAQQTHVNKCSPDALPSEKHPPKMTNMKLICMAMLLAAVLFISLGAIVLSIINFIASGSIKLDATNDGIVSQLGIQLDALDTLAIIEQAQITKLHCGDGVWHRVAHINMSDPSQQCPSAWREYYDLTSNIRVCGRANITGENCSFVSLSTTSIGRLYSRVCGRVIGYQVTSPDAFGKHAGDDNIPFDGVNITYGTHHIWSYVASWSENSQLHSCPCSNLTTAESTVPSFIGKRYYCESGNPADTLMKDHLYHDDPLWDGQQCEGTCCTGTNSPPWFSVQLPAPTTDAIKVSICADQNINDEDTPIQLLEIYVQ